MVAYLLVLLFMFITWNFLGPQISINFKNIDRALYIEYELCPIMIFYIYMHTYTNIYLYKTYVDFYILILKYLVPYL
jgi:hypothetical protein